MLSRAVGRDALAHAYLFSGPAGAGKHTTAVALAMARCCPDEPGRGCGACATCERIDAGIHPDVQTLARQGAAQIIPIDTIRKQVVPQLGMPPHEAPVRFFLVEEATAMQEAAQNALLKTLEEPPPRTCFVLSTTAPFRLLPTIRSRCQRIAFSALPAKIRAGLEAGGDVDAGAEAVTDLVTAIHRAIATSGMQAALDAGAAARDRGEVALAMSAIAADLADRARAVARAGDDLGQARILAESAGVVLEAQTGLTMFNAHPQLAVEDLVDRLRERLLPLAEVAHG